MKKILFRLANKFHKLLLADRFWHFGPEVPVMQSVHVRPPTLGRKGREGEGNDGET